ncbi:unnamed protein product [Rangifer tarandus platyrhynchus]|uniref:Uncharacterized protein n=1 Tax=Rangifer tarandus platyrhynchus TaxID=3082113 RepID=A0ACB1MJD2_RANTA
MEWSGSPRQGAGVGGRSGGKLCPQPDHRSAEGATGLPFGRAGQPGARWEPQQRGANPQELRVSTHKLSEQRPWPDGQLAKPWSLCQAQHTGTGPGRCAARWGNVGTPRVTTAHGALLPAGKPNPGGKAPEKMREAVNTPQNKYCRGVSHTHTPPAHPPLLRKQEKPGSSAARILWETDTVDPACSPAGVRSPGQRHQFTLSRNTKIIWFVGKSLWTLGEVAGVWEPAGVLGAQQGGAGERMGGSGGPHPLTGGGGPGHLGA